MRRFKFFIGDVSGKFLYPSNGYFTCIRHLPSEFTETDIQNESFFTPNIKKRSLKMRGGTILKISKLCKWSSESGGAEFLYIKCIDGSNLSKLDALKVNYTIVSSQIDNINEELYKLAKDLIDELKGLEKTRKQLEKEISSIKKIL